MNKFYYTHQSLDLERRSEKYGFKYRWGAMWTTTCQIANSKMMVMMMIKKKGPALNVQQ